MNFRHRMCIAVFLCVLFLGNTAFAAPQNSTNGLDRLNAEVTKQKTVLDDTSRTKIQNSCQTAQGNLKNLRQKGQNYQRERSETYLDIENEIDALRLRLKRQAIEVSGIANGMMGYRELTAQYDQLSQAYIDALSDTIDVDCHNNPEAFMAGLSLVRQKRELLLANTNSINNSITKTFHEQFDLIKKSLKV